MIQDYEPAKPPSFRFNGARPKCPKCAAKKVTRHGRIKTATDPIRYQWFCKECASTFVAPIPEAKK